MFCRVFYGPGRMVFKIIIECPSELIQAEYPLYISVYFIDFFYYCLGLLTIECLNHSPLLSGNETLASLIPSTPV